VKDYTKMGELRWKGVSKEKRSLHGSAAAKKRWSRVAPQERSRLMSELGSLGGRPRGGRRCPCGAMTLKRAETRADADGTGLGHEPGCIFYRSEPKKRHPAIVRIRKFGSKFKVRMTCGHAFEVTKEELARGQLFPGRTMRCQACAAG
jgi:hypothetical protein